MSDLIDREKLRTWLEARQYVNPTAREDSWNQAMQTAIRGLDALDAAPSPALTREALHSAMYDDGCIKPPQTDHVQHVLSALGAPPPARPEAWDGDAQHYRSPDGVHLGALRTAWNTDPDRSPTHDHGTNPSMEHICP